MESSFGFENNQGLGRESSPANGGLEEPAAVKAGTDGDGNAIKTATDSHVVPFVEVDELLEQSLTENVVAPDEQFVRRESDSEEPAAAGMSQSNQAEAEALHSAAAHPEDRLEESANATAMPAMHEPAAKNGEPDDEEREKLLIAGLRYYKRGQFDDAITEFRQTVERFPNFKEAHSILGNAYFRNRMYDDARIAYTRVKELDPSDTTAYENMGVIFANRGEYMDAMKEWQRVLEIDPSRDDIRRKIELAARMMMKRATVQ